MSAISAANQLAQVALGDDSDFLGWTQGGGPLSVEIVFDFMCPGSKAVITEISNEKDDKTVDIFDFFSNKWVDIDDSNILIMD